MAGLVCSKSSDCSFDDELIEDRYYQLLDAFKELHVDAIKMQY